MLDTSPPMGMPPNMSYTPTHWLTSLCICMFRGYLHGIWGILSLCWGLRGCSPLCWGFGGIYTSVKLWCLAVHPLGVHYALSCTFFVVHYDSCIHNSYDYYSSSYGGVFWSVIFFTSDHGTFLDGTSATSGQCKVVLLPPLMPRCPGDVIGLASVSQK